MKNLYSFSKDAWFVKLYKWLYNVDLTQKYKNMCPMFWALIITFIILPFVVLAKLCGNLSVAIYRYINVKKEINYQKRKQKFLDYCKLELTPEAAYKLYHSAEWSEFCYFVSNELWGKIYDLKSQYIPPFPKKKLINIDSELIGLIIMSIGVGILFIGFLYYMPWGKIDWKLLCEALFQLINIIIFCVGFYHIFKYFFINSTVFNFFIKIGNYISRIANKVWHGVRIVYDMIYNIYKKNCPLIEWT